MRRDIHNNIETEVALNIQTISTNTTTAGNIIDAKGFNSLEFVLLTGTLTDGDYAPSVYEGDASDLSDAAVLAAGDYIGTVAAGSFTADTDDNVTRRIGIKVGNKRYYRLSIISTSTTSGSVIAAIAILSNKDKQPTSADA